MTTALAGKPADHRWRLAVIINAAAGTMLHGDGEAICRNLREELAKTQDLVSFILAAPAEMAAAMADAFGSDAELVLIGGGDGTIQHAAALAVASGKTLGILPLGTLNMLARELRIPLDLGQAVAVLRCGRATRIDVADVGGELCLLKAMAGRLSASIRLREIHRHRLRYLAWLRMAWTALRLLLQRGRTRFSLVVDGEQVEVHAMVLMVSLNRFGGRLEQPFARDRLDGGRLVVYGLSAWTTRRHSRDSLVRSRDQGLLDRFILAEGSHVSLSMQRNFIHLSIDGEMHLMRSPVEITVKARALSVLVPDPEGVADDQAKVI